MHVSSGDVDHPRYNDRLIFMHFPKTGGTTVHNCLSKLFHHNEICPERYDQISFWPKDILDNYRFFSAHAFLSSFSLISDRANIITFLRDPLERNFSAFDFWSSFTNQYINDHDLHIARLAKSLGVNGLFGRENRAQCASLYNVYANWLLGIRFSPFGAHRHEKPADIAEQAIAVLDKLSYVGISEDLELSFEQLSLTLDIPNTYGGQRDNVTRENIARLTDIHEHRAFEEIKADTLAALTEATEADQLIYEYASKKFFSNRPPQRRLKGISGSPTIAIVRQCGNSCWIESRGEGFILFGPYLRLRPGRYLVEFRCRVSLALVSASAGALGYVDAVADLGQTLLSRSNIYIGDQSGDILVHLEFETSTVFNDIEFRCFSFGNEQFSVNETTILYNR
jgi:hypothetical protein